MRTARLKVNLCLHVTGRRADGLHELDSLVTFADFGDRLALAPAPAGLVLELDPAAPFADRVPAGADNLALRAGRRLARRHPAGARIRLAKDVPVGAGLGGGSADAAAVLRGLRRLWNLPLADADLAALAFRLGADIPVCLGARPARLRGAGERVDPVPLPRFPAVLVWPGVAIATPAAFAAFAARGAPGPGLPPLPRRLAGPAALADWLRHTRNDLEPAAGEAAAAVAAARAALLAAGALHAAMSGSGSAVCGIFAAAPAAARAARALARARPDWWCRAVTCGDGPAVPAAADAAMLAPRKGPAPPVGPGEAGSGHDRPAQ